MPRTASPTLVRDVGIAIAVKLAVLTVIYLAFFGPGAQPHIDAARVSNTLFASPSTASQPPDGAAR